MGNTKTCVDIGGRRENNKFFFRVGGMTTTERCRVREGLLVGELFAIFEFKVRRRTCCTLARTLSVL